MRCQCLNNRLATGSRDSDCIRLGKGAANSYVLKPSSQFSPGSRSFHCRKKKKKKKVCIQFSNYQQAHGEKRWAKPPWGMDYLSPEPLSMASRSSIRPWRLCPVPRALWAWGWKVKVPLWRPEDSPSLLLLPKGSQSVPTSMGIPASR